MGLDLTKYPQILEATVFAEGVLWGMRRVDVAWLWSQVAQAALTQRLADYTDEVAP